MATYSQNVTLTNAAVEHLFGRPVKNRGVLGAKGGPVTLVRLRGGCWTISGEGKARVASAIERLKAAMLAVQGPLVRPVYSKKPVSTVVLASDFYGRQLTVSRVGDSGTLLGTIKGERVTVTGTDAEDVLAKLVAACPPVKATVKKETFHGHLLKVTKTTRGGIESFFGQTQVHGLRIMFTGGTYREVYKNLLSVLAPVSGAKAHRQDEAIEPAAVGITCWADDSVEALFNGLGL